MLSFPATESGVKVLKEYFKPKLQLKKACLKNFGSAKIKPIFFEFI